MGGAMSKEIDLVEQLKATCDKDGKETNQVEASNLFHQLSLIYKGKSSDKISLIQSAALINAAIVRQPSSDEFKKTRQELCFHVLHMAGAKQGKANLLKVTQHAASKIKEMRDHTNISLEKLKKLPYGLPVKEEKALEETFIEQVRNLQNNITDSYKKVMSYIAEKAEEVMGKPPCRYSVTAMGSLARKEVTPFSDFEHVIVLEEGVQHTSNYSEILEYFRWLTVIFQIIVINLGETILPSVAIPWLNDFYIPDSDWFFDAHTTRGISFDGMMPHACKFPLGRTIETEKKPWATELIKPVSLMTTYLEAEEDIKNGYHPSDILTKTCFVFGHKDVHDKFQEKVKETLSKERSNNHKILLKQVKEDMENFKVLQETINASQANNCNIKRAVYRSLTLFVSALGKLHQIPKSSCYEIVVFLFKWKIINRDNKHKLLYAISVACSTRLKVYMLKGKQDDVIRKVNVALFDSKALDELFEIVGEQALISYFMTTDWLQTCLRIGDKKSLKKFNLPLSNKFTMLLHLQRFRIIDSEWERYKDEKVPVGKTFDDVAIRQMVSTSYMWQGQCERALTMNETILKVQNKWVECFSRIQGEDRAFEWITHITLNKVLCLNQLNRFSKALEWIEFIEDSFKTRCNAPVTSCNLLFLLSKVYNTKAEIFVKDGQYEEAYNYGRSCLEVLDRLSAKRKEDVDSFKYRQLSYAYIAKFHFYRKQFEEAKENLILAINLESRTNSPLNDIIYWNKMLTQCYKKLNQPQKTKECLEKHKYLLLQKS